MTQNYTIATTLKANPRKLAGDLRAAYDQGNVAGSFLLTALTQDKDPDGSQSLKLVFTRNLQEDSLVLLTRIKNRLQSFSCAALNQLIEELESSRDANDQLCEVIHALRIEATVDDAVAAPPSEASISLDSGLTWQPLPDALLIAYPQSAILPTEEGQECDVILRHSTEGLIVDVWDKEGNEVVKTANYPVDYLHTLAIDNESIQTDEKQTPEDLPWFVVRTVQMDIQASSAFDAAKQAKQYLIDNLGKPEYVEFEVWEGMSDEDGSGELIQP